MRQLVHAFSSLILLTALFAAPARAAEPRRKVAVLEYRGGVEQAPGLGQHLADKLAKTSSLTVVDPQEARRRLPRVDSDIARCAGDAGCVANVGRKLGVDEVLLVGISQLGDIVLALQRIDVAESSVGARVAETLPADAEVDDAKLTGWLRQLYPPDTFKRYGWLSITSNVDGATVTINGQNRGETPLAGKVKVLAPRSYRVNVTKEGFVAFVSKVDVPPDATFEVNAELVAENAPLPWYKRWYVWAIVGGVVAAAAIGTAVYFAQPDNTHVQGFINW